MPAQASRATWATELTSERTDSGMSAARVSPGARSRNTPIFINTPRRVLSGSARHPGPLGRDATGDLLGISQKYSIFWRVFAGIKRVCGIIRAEAEVGYAVASR